MGKADLHIHTTASDGKMAPEEVVEVAKKLNLSFIAITDHDTIKGVRLAREYAKDMDLEVLSGVEITTSFNKKEIHLLAYNFNLESPKLIILLKNNQQARVQRAKWIIGELRKKGLELDIEEVIAEASARNVGRPHIAEILKKKGYIGSIREAFIRYLSDDALGPIKSDYTNIEKVITIVKQAGGVAVLAHPGRLYSEQELTLFVEAGIDGLEAIHPSHNYEIQKEMEDFARRNNLLTTGGSDFHGATKSYYRHLGVLTTTMQQLKKIKALSNHRKEVSV